MTKIDYQKLSDELDEILAKLQSAEIGVDEATEAFERGLKIADQLEEYLTTAKNKIERVKGQAKEK